MASFTPSDIGTMLRCSWDELALFGGEDFALVATMTSTSRSAGADELLRRLAAALRASQLYSKGHPLITRNLAALVSAVASLHEQEASTVIGVVGEKIIVDDAPSRADGLTGLVRRLKQIGIERITIDRGVTADELQTLVDAVCTLEPRRESEPPSFPTLDRLPSVKPKKQFSPIPCHGRRATFAPHRRRCLQS